MKRFGLLGLVLLVMCGFGGATASSSMAACLRTAEAGKGTFKNSACTEAEAGGPFIWVKRLVTYLGNGVWCAETTNANEGNYTNGTCTTLGVGNFVKVFAGPFRRVNGARFESGTKQIKLQLKSNAAVLVSPKLELEVECKNSISEGATIEGNGLNQGQGKGRVSYSSCKVLKPNKAECTVAEPITTKPIKSYLAFREGAQQEFVEVFEPTEGNVFTNLTFSKGCPLIIAGTQPVDGSAAAELVPKEAEVQEGLVNFPTTPIEKVKHEGVEKTIGLTIGGSTNSASFSAAYGARLATFPEKFGTEG